MRDYAIYVIKDYPDDGNHLECDLSLPFQIRRGEDGYYYRDKKGIERKYNIYKGDKIDDRWIVHLHSNEGSEDGLNPSLVKIFHIMVDKDLDKIIDYCFSVYEKSLRMELKRIEKLKKEMKII